MNSPEKDPPPNFVPLLNPITVHSKHNENSNFPLGEHEEIEFVIGGHPSHSNSNTQEVEVVIKDGVLYSTQTGAPVNENVEDDDEWEETTLYIDLDDIPNLEELFAVKPDDFLLDRKNRDFEDQKQKPRKPTHSKLKFRFHNFDTKEPVLQIGQRFFEGTFQEPLGTFLFFRQKPKPMSTDSSNDLDHDIDHKPSDTEIEVEPSDPLKSNLHNLLPELTPEPDPLFGNYLKSKKDYQLVAQSSRVVKMTRRNLLNSSTTTEKPESEENESTPTPTPMEVPEEDSIFKRPKTPPPKLNFS